MDPYFMDKCLLRIHSNLFLPKTLPKTPLCLEIKSNDGSDRHHRACGLLVGESLCPPDPALTQASPPTPSSVLSQLPTTAES